MLRRITVSLLVLGLASALAAGAAAAKTLQEVLNTGTLRVGIALFTPWAARASGGDLIGFEIDVARQVAADMGVKIELLTYEFDRLIPALESGEIDLIAAGLIVTPERALHVNFSAPYAESGVSLATHSASTAHVRRLEDLDTPSVAIGVVEGSAAAELAQRLLPRAKLAVFASADRASAELLAGAIQAYLEEDPIPTFLALEHPGTVDVPIERPLLLRRAAFAVNKGDPDFLAFLNAWITAREADTWLPTTSAYWFESLRWRARLEPAANR